ncbi:hypothetical protein TL16_g11765 [Triparma laevis f. inornata]|uniref:Uncharacterized protein n=1 Tax=Triparma laevis f. inornata TaxID=1714386 RepID=A0A9W7BMN7_9STRA|nr:hypothetical protein TL16_g11765 [Triparma laevis f. inornata]
MIIPLSPPPVSDPVEPAGPVLEYQNHKTVLPAETRPQMQKKVSVILKNYSHDSTPSLRVGVTCNGAKNALREATQHVRASVEIRKTKDDSWVSATNPPESMGAFYKHKGHWTWSSYFQFTHVSLFQDPRKPSTGPLTLSFFVSSDDLEETCLLSSDQILVQAKPKGAFIKRYSSRGGSAMMESPSPPNTNSYAASEIDVEKEMLLNSKSSSASAPFVSEVLTPPGSEIFDKHLSEVGDAELRQVLKRRYQNNNLNSARIEEIMSQLDNPNPHPKPVPVSKKKRIAAPEDSSDSCQGSSSPSSSTSSISSKEGSEKAKPSPVGTGRTALSACERNLLSKFAQETFPFIQELVSYCSDKYNHHPRKLEIVSKELPQALEKIAGLAADAEQDYENSSYTSKALHKFLKAKDKSSSNYIFMANKLRRANLNSADEMVEWKEEMNRLNESKGEAVDKECPIANLLESLEEMRLQPVNKCTKGGGC